MSPKRIEHALGWHLDDLSDFAVRLVIEGPAAVLKNSRRLFIRGGRPRSLPSTAASAFLLTAADQLRTQWRAVFARPLPAQLELNAAIITYLPTRRRPDASNLYEAPQDAMKACNRRCKPRCEKHAGVITDDVQIAAHDGSRRRYDKLRPRVEILLTPFSEAS